MGVGTSDSVAINCELENVLQHIERSYNGLHFHKPFQLIQVDGLDVLWLTASKCHRITLPCERKSELFAIHNSWS